MHGASGPTANAVPVTGPLLVDLALCNAYTQKAISGCERCIQQEGAQVKAPLQAILVTSPLELLHAGFHWHWDDSWTRLSPTCSEWFWSFLTTSQDTSWHMWLLIRTAKSFAKFLWQGYISIFQSTGQAPEWLQGATFESNIISELCELMGIWKARTFTIQHPKTNRQVEQVHQTLLQMVGKLGKDQKAGLA